MLTLAVAQIEATMTDGEKSVSELSESFTYIASRIAALSEAGDRLESSINDQSDIEEIKSGTCEIHQRINQSIMAFQFYDRLTQRLHHVKRDLAGLSELINDSSQLYNPNAWHNLQQDIAANYTMEEERIMFQHIMQGASVEQALEIYRHHFTDADTPGDDNTDDDVELF
ncbi:hypothetical protein OLMES_2507 [Oleiphilus messinensis]|uniref:Uncharacterized protein n=2 Tax=Oleiphilus messinensis TaxID=141451 RepID=A0A1Y0IAS1_9GAMM|nr:hypothetical protein OLMES_2507 [Oleiphilus messinensis]